MNRLRWGDIVVGTLFVAAIGFSILMVKKSPAGRKRLVVMSGSSQYVYPMDRAGRYEIEGAVGRSVILIKDGQACFEDSPCPNKTCVHSGFISENGSWAACLPNDVFIRVESDGDPEVDAVAF